MLSLTVSFLFSWYLSNFVRTDSYGPLAAMMGFLLWTWLSVQVILMGAELNAENNGIVFLDEIDKIARGSDNGVRGGDVSREGVQRDLLPLIEGTTVSTKHGPVKTSVTSSVASRAWF